MLHCVQLKLYMPLLLLEIQYTLLVSLEKHKRFGNDVHFKFRVKKRLRKYVVFKGEFKIHGKKLCKSSKQISYT